MSKTSNISSLKEAIDFLPKMKDGKDFMDKVTLLKEDVMHLASWDKDKYVRVSLNKTPAYELAVLFWEDGVVSAIHDHNQQEGWVKVIDGKLSEDIYELKNNIPVVQKRIVANKGELSHINDSKGIHRMLNDSGARTISLHLYTKSFESIFLYDEQTGKKTEVFV